MMISDRLDPGHFPATVDLMAEERATLVTILLQRHRMIHGEFPDSLVELAYGDEIISMQLTDPWSGTPFFYAPKGLPTPIRLGFENKPNGSPYVPGDVAASLWKHAFSARLCSRPKAAAS